MAAYKRWSQSGVLAYTVRESVKVEQTRKLDGCEIWEERAIWSYANVYWPYTFKAGLTLVILTVFCVGALVVWRNKLK